MRISSRKLQHIVLHDNLNISLNEALDAAYHKSTRIDYHNECCTKGGDAFQSCSWNRGTCLVTGAYPDSLHANLVKILEQQKNVSIFICVEKS